MARTMSNNFSTAKGPLETEPARSKNMRAIRSTGNRSTEIRLRKLLRAGKFRGWRSQPKKLAGKPDFVFPNARVVVFVDGCFWHGCRRCPKGHIPKSRLRYWLPKLARNRRRDRKISSILKSKGWTVLRIWEHALNKPKRVESLL